MYQRRHSKFTFCLYLAMRLFHFRSPVCRLSPNHWHWSCYFSLDPDHMTISRNMDWLVNQELGISTQLLLQDNSPVISHAINVTTPTQRGRATFLVYFHTSRFTLQTAAVRLKVIIWQSQQNNINIIVKHQRWDSMISKLGPFQLLAAPINSVDSKNAQNRWQRAALTETNLQVNSST